MKRYIKSAIIDPINEDKYTRQELVQDSNISEDIRYEMSKDLNQDYRVPIAKNPNTSPKLLTQMADDRSNKVRIAVASNPNTPPEVLLNLCTTYGIMPLQCNYESFIIALAKNPSTPIEYRKELIAYLFRFPHWDDGKKHLYTIANSKLTPVELLHFMEKECAKRRNCFSKIQKAISNNLSKRV